MSMIESVEQLEALYGPPLEMATVKEVDHVTPEYARFIAASPFVALATSGPEGLDCSPRGDLSGFVRVADPRTLLMPDRRGNNRVDSLRNIVRNGHVGLLFVIPGVGDTFRVNGRATLITDQTLLAPCVVEGQVPKLGILVDIEQAYTQCSKAFIRSQLWDPERFVDRATLPTNGEILRSFKGGSFDSEAYDRERAARYRRREGFY